MYVLFQYYTIIPGELPGCLHQMILLNPAKTNMSSKEYHLSQLKTIKEFLFISKKSAEQLEMMNINAPLFHLIASYFYEFDPHSSWGMTDFIVTTLDKLNNQDAVYDISVLLYSFDNGCRGLSVHEDSAVRIASILDIIENVLLQLDGYDVVVWNTVLSLAQFLLEYVHDTIGISYGAWFESIFMKIQSVAETKKLQESFMNLFIDIIPYELPSILQIHAKVVHQKSSLNHASQLIRALKNIHPLLHYPSRSPM
ncbi:hypothetical protein BDB01DRAFT_54262 [Pilobolus umbonatus]|nr:hypothetical protein BDB01DRAFT_54262 [Pilobolus umbonatus]